MEEEYPQKGMTYPDNRLREEKKYDPDTGVGEDEFFSNNPTDPADPYAHLTSNPTTQFVNKPVDFDASKSHDCDHEPCVKYVFDFGDGSPKETSDKPIVPHSYKYPGVYPVEVTVTDKYGKTGKAQCAQRIIDPKDPDAIGPPYAQLTSDPTESRVGQNVYFDASKSHDFKKEPVVDYVFDFGDGTKPLHSKVPKVTHPYEKRGAYPVTCEVTDKYGQKAKAGLQQRVIDPEMQDPLGPYAHLKSNPTEAKTKEPVEFDASKSCDCNGDPVKKYVFDFGDGSPKKTSFKPVVHHPYAKGGTYPVSVEVTCKYGKKATAEISQRVKDPFNPTKKGPPYAALNSTPPEAEIEEPVTFDASESHDYLNKPCEMFVWDFGDNSPKKTSTTPIVQHPYKEAGTYKVTVNATDKYGQTAKASCNQRVRPPPPYVTADSAEKIDDPYVTVESTPTNAKVKQPVTFDASKSHDMDKDPLKKYLWDFGDGSPKVETTGPVVKHAYDEPGTYPVKVVGTDKYGRKGDAKLSQLVTDPKSPNDPLPPYAHVRSDPPIQEVKKPVKFDASKSHDQFNKPCVQFVWDFGDGSPKVTTPGPRTNHPYEKPGTYPVKVVVTDKNGLSAQAGLNQKVIQKGPSVEDPYAAVSSTPPEAKPKEPVRFDASKSHDMDGDPCKTFKWDFGDGTPPVTTTTPIVNHPYEKPGTYPVKVTVTDKNNRQGNASLQQKVIDPKNPKKKGPPYAALKSTPPEAAINQPVLFDASDSHDFEGNPCVKYLWDFGDGSPKKTTKEPTVEHPYKKAGVFPVTVEVTDKFGQKGKAGVNQRVREPGPEDPYAALQSTPPDAKVKEPVKFDASRSVDMDGDPCKTFVFDFGDKSPPVTSDKPVVNHAYDEPGTYPVTVTVTDKYGNRGNASLQQKVSDPLQSYNIPSNDPTEDPYVAVSSTPPIAKKKEPVVFDASKSHDMDGDPCKNYTWDFGDGSPLVHTPKPVVTHAYDEPGSYPVKVIATDKYNRKGDATLTQKVIDPKNPKKGPPYAAVKSNPPISDINEPVDFDASESKDFENKPCTKFVWDFGDGSPKKTTKTPTTKHPYKAAGKYPVTVEVTDKHGQTANAGLTQKVAPGGARNERVLPTEDPYVTVSSTPPEAKVKQPVTFDASKSHDMDKDPLKKYLWDYGDGSPLEETTGPVTKHAYDKPGVYPVTVVGTDKYNRKGHAKLSQRVKDPKGGPSPPYAAIESTPPDAKENEPVLFDASKSKDYQGKPVVSYEWDFGDGSPKKTTKEPRIKHPYEKAGTYPVTVEVTDKNGLKADAGLDQRVIPRPVKNSKRTPTEDPYVTVSSTPSQAKINEPVTFDASPSHDMDGDPLKKYVWDFGDGSPKKTTTEPIVEHPYKKAGTYPVTVTGTDKYGRTGDAKCTQLVIDPKNPKKKGPPYAALQSTPPDAEEKEPVTFDASKSHDFEKKPVVKYLWDFGDGSPKKTTKTPLTKHAYEQAGTYPVTVQVTDKYDQKADAKINQRVVPPGSRNLVSYPTEDPYVTVSSKPTNAKVKEPVTFDASPSHDMDGEPLKKYLWDYGDGSPLEETTGPVTKHAYDKPGVYPVTVVGTDKYNRKGTAKLAQRVIDPKQPSTKKLPPYAAITSTPPESMVGQPVEFDASKSHDGDKKPCVKFTWDFGDGSPKEITKGPKVKHPYQHEGTYPVTVEVTDKLGQTADAGLNQRVIDEQDEKSPMKGMTYPDNRRRDDPETKDPEGKDDDSFESGPQPPYAAVKSTPPESVPGQPVLCDASDSKDFQGNPCVKYVWDFGDGSPKKTTTTPTTEHPYKKSGVYPISVEVTDKNGLTGNAGCNQRVREPEIEDPFAHVTSDPQYAKPKEPVKFDASKSHDMDGDPCKTFLWDYGDGTPLEKTTTPVTNHAYDEPGTYPVTVTVTDKYGRKGNANLTQQVIDPKEPNKVYPPVAELESHPHESVPKQPVSFDASKSRDFKGEPCKKFVWDFGDGSPKKTTTEPKTTHPYQKPGTYPVSVEVTDKYNQTARAGVNQRVREPGPEDPYVQLNNEPPISKPKEPVTFDASKSVDMDGDPCKNYTFDFGDGSPVVHTPKPIVKHAYDEPGSYPVTVTATDKYGRKGNAAVTQKVIDPKNPKKKGPPYAHVTSDPPDARPKQPVTFDASKSCDMDKKPCVKFVWDFGDGTPKKTTKGPEVKHPYAKPGVYPVTVQVTDKYNQTADAFLNQRVSDPGVTDSDPSRGPRAPKNKTYGGKKGKGGKNPNPAGNTFGSKGGNKKPGDPDSFANVPPEESKEAPGMDPDEIGDEFRNIVRDATSNAILDPNQKNNRDGKKLAAVMKQLNPAFPDELDPEAKKQFGKFNKKPLKPTKPYPKALPKRPLPKPGEKRLHHVETQVHVDVGKPIMPDI